MNSKFLADTWQQRILKDSDLCVLCGMCIPQCPTYHIYQREHESPRGRISLIKAYAQGELQASDRLAEHLNHCLGCMACQAICPSGVPYGQLIDQARQQLYREKPPAVRVRSLLKNTLDKTRLKGYQALFKTYQYSGLPWLVEKSSGWLSSGLKSSLDIARLAEVGQLQPFYPAQSTNRGRIALFTGCMGTSFDIRTLNDSIRLLNHYGYEVEVPEQQVCCGALHQHNGQMENADQLATDNDRLFSSLDTEALIYCSNGCGAQLQHKLSQVKSFDILQFLLSHSDIQQQDFQPLQQRVMIHESCSTQNILKSRGLSQALLSLIPGLEIVEMKDDSRCCGAGGSHQIQFPELSQQLLAPKLVQLGQDQPAYLLSDNLGCSLHIQAGLNRQGLAVKVLHPVSLLALCIK